MHAVSQFTAMLVSSCVQTHVSPFSWRTRNTYTCALLCRFPPKRGNIYTIPSENRVEKKESIFWIPKTPIQTPKRTDGTHHGHETLVDAVPLLPEYQPRRGYAMGQDGHPSCEGRTPPESRFVHQHVVLKTRNDEHTVFKSDMCRFWACPVPSTPHGAVSRNARPLVYLASNRVEPWRGAHVSRSPPSCVGHPQPMATVAVSTNLHFLLLVICK